MIKQKAESQQKSSNRVVLPVHAYSDDRFVRMMSEMIGLDPKAGESKKK